MRQSVRSCSRVALVAALAAGLATGAGALAEAPPSGAQPGQCFGRVRYPDQVAFVHTRVQVRTAERHRRMSPAVVRTIFSRVLVAPSRTFKQDIPARYASVSRVVTTRGALRSLRVPARYGVERTRIEVAPSRLVWVRRSGTPQFAEVLPGQTELTPTGEVLCRVRLPARFATRTRRVLVSAARRLDVEGQPLHRRVTERVLVAPARTIERTHPAVYRTVSRTVVLRPAHETWVAAPGVWRDRVQERRTARAGWAQVVCPNGLAPWAMQRLQSGLAARGYDAGPSDGQARPQTLDALRRFQNDNGMAEGQITVESARALGVVP